MKVIGWTGWDFCCRAWQEHPFFNGNTATEDYKVITECFDDFLLGQGFKHEQGRWLCEAGTSKTIALYCHGGSGACVLAHLLSLPFPYVLAVMPFNFASITVVDLPAEKGTYVHPVLELFNDCVHISRHSDDSSLQ